MIKMIRGGSRTSTPPPPDTASHPGEATSNPGPPAFPLPPRPPEAGLFTPEAGPFFPEAGPPVGEPPAGVK